MKKNKKIMMKNLFYLILLCPLCLFSQTWQQIGSDIDGEDEANQMGYSTSMSADGNIVAVGEIGNDWNGLSSGAVHIYQYNGTIWEQIGQTLYGDTASESFGITVSLSADGNILAIGAYGANAYAGKVEIYQYDGTSWTQLGQDLGGEVGNDQFGRAITINSDGNIIAVGAYGNDTNGSNSGASYIYQYDGTSWVQMGETIYGEMSSDYSGIAVDLDENGGIIAIGAYMHNGDTGFMNGQVKIYKYDGTSWMQHGQIDGEEMYGLFGGSLSLNNAGDIIAVGASGINTNTGQVKTYEYDGTSWIQLGETLNGLVTNDYYGNLICLDASGTQLLVAVPGNDTFAENAGSIQSYQYDGTSWTQTAQDIYGEAAGDGSLNAYSYLLSMGVSSDGSKLVVGAPANDGNGNFAGQVRVFEKVIEVEDLTISTGTEDTEIFVGETLQLEVTVTPDNANQEVSWSVEFGTESVSIDSNGLITGLAAGTVIIRATSVTDSDIYDEIEIVVKNEVATVNINTEGNVDTEIFVSETIQLEAFVLPDDADQEVEWSVSSGEEYASVDENGLVTGISEGTATIRATSVENSDVYGEIEITVMEDIMTVSDLDHTSVLYYPNPVTTDLHLEVKGQKIKSVQIYNMNGAEVLTQSEIDQSKSSINLLRLPKGTYMVKLKTDVNTEIFKIIKL